MAKKPEALPVLFRVMPGAEYRDDGTTAVFPTVPGTSDPHDFTVYAHIGQHGAGNRGWYNRTRAAKPEEYADLLAELQRIYAPEYRLVVGARFTRKHDEIRRAELRASREA